MLTRLALGSRKPAPFQSLLTRLDWRRGLDQAHNPTFLGRGRLSHLTHTKRGAVLEGTWNDPQNSNPRVHSDESTSSKYAIPNN